MRRGVGGECLTANADAWPVIGTASVNGAAREDNGRQSCVGAAVNREVDLAAQDFTALADGGTMPRAGRMTLRGRRHVFQTVIDDFHRASRLHC